MSDLATAIALVLVIEGVLWAASPDAMKRAAAYAQQAENGLLRRVGLAAAAAGVAVVWMIRG